MYLGLCLTSTLVMLCLHLRQQSVLQIRAEKGECPDGHDTFDSTTELQLVRQNLDRQGPRNSNAVPVVYTVTLLPWHCYDLTASLDEDVMLLTHANHDFDLRAQ